MEPIVEVGAAAILAGYLVAFFKLAAPSAPSSMLVFTALVSGVVSAFLIALSTNGEAVMEVQQTAQTIVQGLIAAATAAGLTRTDEAGEKRRDEA